MRSDRHFKPKVHLVQNPASSMAASWSPEKSKGKASTPFSPTKHSTTALFGALKSSWTWCRCIFEYMLACLMVSVCLKPSSTSGFSLLPECQSCISNANSSFNVCKVEGLSPLPKWLRSVISTLSAFDRLVFKQTLQTAKCHQLKAMFREELKAYFFYWDALL